MKYYSTSIIAAQKAQQAISELSVTHHAPYFPTTSPVFGLPTHSLPSTPPPTPDVQSDAPDLPRPLGPHRRKKKKKKKKAQYEIGLMENPQEMLVGSDDDGFDIYDYMADKRAKADAKKATPAPKPTKKCKTRPNNIVHTETKSLADALFDTSPAPKITPQPEPPRIRPLLRYTPDEQKSLQKRMFAQSKEFVIKTHPDKTDEDLEKAIFEEMNRRMKAWEGSH
jgi:hypothetical protein